MAASLVFPFETLDAFEEAPRRLVIGALLVAALADDTMDPGERALLGPLFEKHREDVRAAKAARPASDDPEAVRAFGKTCADALTTSQREQLAVTMLTLARGDDVVRPTEKKVIDAFLEGLGIPAARLTELEATASTGKSA